LPMVMAEDGLFPQVFRRTSRRFGTPVVSLLVGGLALSGLCRLKFSYLTGLFSIVQVLAYMLIYAALLRLRTRPPRHAVGSGTAGRVVPVAAVSGGGPGGAAGSQDAERPFRIPLGIGGLVLMTLPSIVLAALVMVQSVWHDGVLDRTQAIVDLAVFASGPVTYLIFRRK